MGDRTYVRLTVLTSQSAVVTQYFDEILTDKETYKDISTFLFEEINYGELPFLKSLQEAGIAYDSTWGNGNGFKTGTKTCRFTPEGKAIVKEIYESEANPEMKLLLQHIDDPVLLRKVVTDHAEYLHILPWDNQEEYGKLYQARQLIEPVVSS